LKHRRDQAARDQTDDNRIDIVTGDQGRDLVALGFRFMAGPRDHGTVDNA